MINALQKAKHWHLFTITFGIPFLIQNIFMIQMMTKMFSENFTDVNIMSKMSIYQTFMMLFMSVMFLWYWAVTVGLQFKVPENVKMKLNKFKFFYFFFILYMIFFAIISMTFFNKPPTFDDTQLLFPFGIAGVIIFPLHLFAMLCILYVVYFSAKTIKTIEFQREVKYSDFAGDFFLILFYPIGIWIIQPKVNSLVQEDTHKINSSTTP